MSFDFGFWIPDKRDRACQTWLNMCCGCIALQPQPSGTYIFPATETIQVTLQSNNVNTEDGRTNVSVPCRILTPQPSGSYIFHFRGLCSRKCKFLMVEVVRQCTHSTFFSHIHYEFCRVRFLLEKETRIRSNKSTEDGRTNFSVLCRILTPQPSGSYIFHFRGLCSRKM